MESTNSDKNGVIFSRIMVNYAVNLSLQPLAFYIWLNSSSCGLQYLAEIKLCEFAAFIYLFCNWNKNNVTSIPYFGP